MTFNDLVQYIGFRAIDQDGVEYSPTEIGMYAKIALDWLLQELMAREAVFAQNKTVLEVDENGADLPEGFIREVAVLDERGIPLTSLDPQQWEQTWRFKRFCYTILGGKIYAGVSPITLFYYKTWDVPGADNPFPSPECTDNLVKEIVTFLVLNRNEFDTSVEQALTQKFESQVNQLVGTYGRANVDIELPWTV